MVPAKVISPLTVAVWAFIFQEFVIESPAGWFMVTGPLTVNVPPVWFIEHATEIAGSPKIIESVTKEPALTFKTPENGAALKPTYNPPVTERLPPFTFTVPPSINKAPLAVTVFPLVTKVPVLEFGAQKLLSTVTVPSAVMVPDVNNVNIFKEELPVWIVFTEPVICTWDRAAAPFV